MPKDQNQCCATLDAAGERPNCPGAGCPGYDEAGNHCQFMCAGRECPYANRTRVHASDRVTSQVESDSSDDECCPGGCEPLVQRELRLIKADVAEIKKDIQDIKAALIKQE